MTAYVRQLGQKVIKIPIGIVDFSVAATLTNITSAAWLDDTRLTMIEKVVIHKTADWTFAGAEKLYIGVGINEAGGPSGGGGEQPDALTWPLLMTTGVADAYLGISRNGALSTGRTVYGIVENALTAAGPHFAQFGGARAPSEQALYIEHEHIMTRMRAAYLSDTAITLAAGEQIDVEWGEFSGDTPCTPGNFSKLAKYGGIEDISGWNNTDGLFWDDTEATDHPRASSPCFLSIPEGERLGCRVSLTNTPLEEDAEIVVEADIWPVEGPTRRLSTGPVPFHSSLGSELRIYAWVKDKAVNLDTLAAGSAEVIVYYRDLVP